MVNKIGMDFFRTVMCILIIKNACFYFPMAESLFGIEGIFPYASYSYLMKAYGLKFLLYPFRLSFMTQLFLIVLIWATMFYLVGYYRKIIGILLLIMLFILRTRNGFILDGSDNVIQVTSPFLVFFDFFDNIKTNNKEFEKFNIFVRNILIYCIKIQVCYVYLFTSLAKLQGELWLNGTAVYYTMRVKEFMATDLNIWLTRNHFFVVFSTYFTVLWELSFTFLIWFRNTKFWIIFFGIVLHLGIWIFMRIDNFSWIMIGTYFIFITNSEYNSIYSFFKKKFSPINYKLNKSI